MPSPSDGSRKRRRAWTPLGVVAACILLVVGCTSRPRAPALRDEPVYQNNQEGFRLLAPEGWTQQARSESPPGKADRERMLVEYKRLSGGKGAAFKVAFIDLPESSDLAAYVTGPSFGIKQWRSTAAPQKVEVGGMAGVRYSLNGRTGNQDLTQEVVAFRRGERVYLFSGLFAADDNRARDEVRQAVSSIIWKN